MKNITAIFLALVFLAATTARAENRRIVFLKSMPVSVVDAHLESIRKALDELRRKSGDEFEIEILKARGDKNRAVELLRASVARERPDVVIAIATLAAEAAQRVLKGSGVPILFCVVADPVNSGIVDKVGVPSGTNVSGVVFTQLREVKIEMAMRLLSRTRFRGGVKFGVVSTDYPSAVGDLKELKKIAAIHDEIEFISHRFPYRPVPEKLPDLLEDLRLGVEAIEDEVDFLWEVPSPLSVIPDGTRVLLDSGKPVMMGNTPEAVEMGVLMAVLTDYQETGEKIVRMAEGIFRGEDVGSMPVTIPENFDLYINLKTAGEYGIKAPSHLLMMAGKNIYR